MVGGPAPRLPSFARALSEIQELVGSMFAEAQGGVFSEAFMAVTGRLSYELVLKAARCGIPLAASIPAPTSLGIELASQCGVMLV